jgi:hypothetical protein
MIVSAGFTAPDDEKKLAVHLEEDPAVRCLRDARKKFPLWHRGRGVLDISGVLGC